jgi:hypothetical protein
MVLGHAIALRDPVESGCAVVQGPAVGSFVEITSPASSTARQSPALGHAIEVIVANTEWESTVCCSW